MKITAASRGFEMEPEFFQHKTAGASAFVQRPETIVSRGFLKHLRQQRTDVRGAELDFCHHRCGTFQRDQAAAFRNQQVRVRHRAGGCAVHILQERIHT